MTTEPEAVRRKPLLAIPGWLLFGCLFVPTLRVCGDPTMPIQFPPSYAVYLGGLVIALLGGARLMRSRRRAFSVLLLRMTQKQFSATQYALFSSLFALPRLLAGLSSP